MKSTFKKHSRKQVKIMVKEKIKSPFSWLFRFRLLRESIWQSVINMSPLEVKTILDIGCGNKPYKSFFEHGKYIGLDLPTSNSEGNCADIYGNGLELPFKRHTFDCVICTEVIEHVPDSTALLTQVHNVLANGGTLILSAPFFWPVHEEPLDFYRFTEFGLCQLLKNNGFSVISIKKRGGFWSMVVMLFAEYIRSDNRVANTLGDLFFAGAQIVARSVDSRFPSNRYALGWTVKALKI